MTQEFDPLDYGNLTRHVVEELMRQPVVPIGSLARFDGAGVYALFYRGDLDFYAGVRSEDSTYAGRYQREDGYPNWSIHAPDMHTDVGSFETLAEIAQGIRAGTAWAAANGLLGGRGWCLYPDGTPSGDWRGGFRA